MKKLLTIVLLFAAYAVNAQTFTPDNRNLDIRGEVINRKGLIVGGTSREASAIAQFTDTAKGILIPCITAAQMAAITSPATGLLIYNTSVNEFHYYNGSAWIEMLPNTPSVIDTGAVVTLGHGLVVDSGIVAHSLWPTTGHHTVTIDTTGGADSLGVGCVSLCVNDTDDLVATHHYVDSLANVPNLISDSAWSLTGNSGTNPTTSFIGTVDSVPLIIRTNNLLRTRINADGSRIDSFATSSGIPVQVITSNNIFGYGLQGYSISYSGLGAGIIMGNLTNLGLADSSIIINGKEVQAKAKDVFYINADSSIIINGKEIQAKAKDVFYIKADTKRVTIAPSVLDSCVTGIYASYYCSINPAYNYAGNVIIGSDQCHIDSGAMNYIIGSYKCAILGTDTNPFNNIAHCSIENGYGDTCYSYHEKQSGPQAVTKRNPYSARGWDKRDVYWSIGNSPHGDSASLAYQQSCFIMLKNGNLAIGDSLSESEIPDTSDAMLTVHGDIAIKDGSQGDGKVLTSDADGNASWQQFPISNDSVTIYALTPSDGTMYYCTDCTGDGITGRIVAYIGAMWRRLTFE